MNIEKLDTASVGYPITRLGVSFFPVYLTENKLPKISTKGLVVDELETAAVPALSVRNPKNKPILLVEGEHLVGGKQNRTVNATVLVPPKSELEIPVSCVERGRWGRKRAYDKDPSFLHNRVRSEMQATVNTSMRHEGSRRGDQGRVWGEVDDILAGLDVESETSAAADAERVYRRNDSLSKAVSELAKLGPLPNQNGVVVTHGDWVKAVDLFGSPHLLAAHWKALTRSYLLEVSKRNTSHSAERALWAIRRFSLMPKETYNGVGMGTELRATDDLIAGQALMLDEMIVHASVFART